MIFTHIRWYRDSSKTFNSIESQPHEVLTLSLNSLIFAINYIFVVAIKCYIYDTPFLSFPWCIHLILMINALRTCHDHSILVRIIFGNLCAANMPWLLACLFIRFDINVIKIHFAMKILKRVNMVMWALETKLVQPKGYGSPWLLDTMVWVLYIGAWLVRAFV